MDVDVVRSHPWRAPENHPISEAAAKELAAGSLSDVQREILSSCCAPLFWLSADAANHPLRHSATMTIAKTPSMILGITAAHVLDEYFNDQGRIQLQLNNAIIDDVAARVVARSHRLDIATLRLDARVLGEVGKNVSPLTMWPPQPPEPDRGMMLAGYPAIERRELGKQRFEFGFFTALGIANTVSDEQITWVPDRANNVGNLPVPPPNYDLGGISGGPVIGLFESPNHFVTYRLSGIISQAMSALDKIVAKRADFIRADGTIWEPP